MPLSRRHLLGLSAAGLLVPRRLLAAPDPSERLFLFVFCDGAWDPTLVFAPLFDNDWVYREPGSQLGQAGVDFVDHPDRPAVRAFFERYGDRCCVINGLDFETVAHDKGIRQLLTGGPAGPDDWGALLAAGSRNDLLLPHLVVSGPTFSTHHASQIVRVGADGQLVNLVQGSLYQPLATQGQDHVAEYLAARSAALADGTQGQSSDWYAAHGRAVAQVRDLEQLGLRLEPSQDYGQGCAETFMAQGVVALDALEQGLGRCAMVQDQGWCRMRWDSHNDIGDQSRHYEQLFVGLQHLMAELDARSGPAGGTLAEQTTVVVCSEMGRHPQLNDLGGKHHWPVTSAMLIGGVTGGRTIGGFDDSVLGRQVDPATGDTTDAGQRLLPGHLGATLLALADLDPAEHVDQPALTGVIA